MNSFTVILHLTSILERVILIKIFVFSFVDGGRSNTLCRHRDQFTLRHDVGTRKATTSASRQDVSDAQGLAQRKRPAAFRASHQ